MTSAYDDAVTALYQATHESFVAERQRLAATLKASGDKLTAARVGKLARPPISAWAVNQLWWHQRAAFEEMFASAAKLRSGDLSARDSHRRAMTKLSAHARQLLSEGGHAASEGTVRRVEATLAGLAAVGSFAPEPAGALTKDRDPPGFEAFSGGSAADPPEPTAQEVAPGKAKAAAKSAAEEAKRAHAEAQRARQEAEAERKRAAEAHAKKQAALRELEAQVRAAKHALAEREREQERAAKALAAAEAEVERARSTLENAQAEHAAAEKDQ